MPTKKKVVDCPPGTEFVFKLPNGTVVGQAKNIVEFEEMLWQVPLPSLVYHTEGKHFGGWLKFIGEDKVAERIDQISPDDIAIRMKLIDAVKKRK
ncbi:MAG: hypothetical protein N3E37_01515 [Candidatus Micrarchaeota archaeon]|nr:hypothetical protein [Candidatus Micrarchaeota archaeon]